MIKFEWDDHKNALNYFKHGAAFEDAPEMFERPMLVQSDNRKDYGEARYIGMGTIQNRLMVVVFTRPKANIVRIISLRKANEREQANYKAIFED